MRGLRPPDVRPVMPKIQWTDHPTALREHPFERARRREVAAGGLRKLKRWRESGPDAPEGVAGGSRQTALAFSSRFRSASIRSDIVGSVMFPSTPPWAGWKRNVPESHSAIA